MLKPRGRSSVPCPGRSAALITLPGQEISTLQLKGLFVMKQLGTSSTIAGRWRRSACYWSFSGCWCFPVAGQIGPVWEYERGCQPHPLSWRRVRTKKPGCRPGLTSGQIQIRSRVFAGKSEIIKILPARVFLWRWIWAIWGKICFFCCWISELLEIFCARLLAEVYYC